MNALAEKLADKKVNSVFLYSHEAHPGEHYPHLTSMEQKFRHAEALRDVYEVTCAFDIATSSSNCVMCTELPGRSM